MPMIALAPCCAACCSSNSYASSRAFSQSSVNTVMFPPMIVWMLAARFPNTLRDRTVIPRTIPKFRSTRYPFSSFPEVTIELSTRPFLVLHLLFPLFVHLFTAAILPLYYHSALAPLCYSRTYVETLFDILAVLQIAAGLYLLWQGIQWLIYVHRRLKTDPGFYAPRTAVLCPCRGIEPGLERNLVSLTEFNHQNYEIFFVLASESDPAFGLVKRVAASSRVKASVILAGKPQNCSEKVNNLRIAIEQLPPEFEVLVFVDSDGRPGKSWLHHMVAPLSDSRIGATTTMRWFIPNSNDPATSLLAAWNAGVVSMLGPGPNNFCWGGGTDIRPPPLYGNRHAQASSAQ